MSWMVQKQGAGNHSDPSAPSWMGRFLHNDTVNAISALKRATSAGVNLRGARRTFKLAVEGHFAALTHPMNIETYCKGYTKSTGGDKVCSV